MRSEGGPIPGLLRPHAKLDESYLKSGWGLRAVWVCQCLSKATWHPHDPCLWSWSRCKQVQWKLRSWFNRLTMIWDSAMLTYAKDMAIERKLQVAILEHDYCFNLSFEQGPRP